MSTTTTASAAGATMLALRVFLPQHATVTVVVHDHRRSRAGTSQTTMSVLATMDGAVADVSGMAAQVTAWRPACRDRVDGTLATDVVVSGFGDPRAAAAALVRDLAATLYGSMTALRLHVL